MIKLFFLLIIAFTQFVHAEHDIPSSHFEIDLQTESDTRKKPQMISLSIVATSLLAQRFSLEERKSKKAMTEYLSIRQHITENSERISAQFKQYFEQVYSNRKSDSYIHFAADLLSTQDVILRAMSLGYLSNVYNAKSSNNKSQLILSKLLISAQSSRSLIIEKKWLNDHDLKSFNKLSEVKDIKFMEYDRYIILGNGLSFLALSDIINRAEADHNPKIKTLLKKYLSDASRGSLLHVYNFALGSAGQYDPISKYLIFSMLSRADLNSWIHEVEHFRFDQFTENFIIWMKSKKYAMPFEMDGPSLEGGGEYGGLHTLLNELNSWRVEYQLGEFRDLPQNEIDQKIIDIFRTLYVSQVGYESINLMNQLWTKEFLSSGSVPQIILKSVKRLNSIPSSEIPDLIKKETDSNRSIQIINLLRLVEVRKTNWQENSKLKAAILHLLSMNRHPEVHKILRSIMKKDYFQFRTLLPIEAQEVKQQEVDLNLRKKIIESLNERQVSEDLDQKILQFLFDSGTTNGKLGVVTQIVNHYQPSELPLTYQKVLSLLKQSDPQPVDHLIARFFLMQEAEPQYKNYTWGLAIHNLFRELHLSEKNLEALFIFYQHNLTQKWQTTAQQLSSQDRALLQEVRDRLNYYSNSKSSMISLGAQAALFENAIYNNNIVDLKCRQVINNSTSQ